MECRGRECLVRLVGRCGRSWMVLSADRNSLYSCRYILWLLARQRFTSFCPSLFLRQYFICLDPLSSPLPYHETELAGLRRIRRIWATVGSLGCRVLEAFS